MVPYCYQLHASASKSGGSDLQYSLLWPDSDTHPQRTEKRAGEDLSRFQEGYLGLSHYSADDKNAEEDVLIFPIIQSGQFGIREEERCMASLFHHLNQFGGATGGRPLMDLTSGYFGLYKPYQELVRTSTVDCRILAASPKVSLLVAIRYRVKLMLCASGEWILWISRDLWTDT